MSLILSKEIYDAGYRIKFKNNDLCKFEHWLTDGEMLIDTRKNYISEKQYNIDECPKSICNSITQLVSDENLRNVLKKENEVNLSDITYKHIGLLVGQNKNHLIHSYYTNELLGLELFYQDNKIYFFEYLEAEPELGINYSGYMFIGLVMGCDEKHEISLNKLRILGKLHKFLESEE